MIVKDKLRTQVQYTPKLTRPMANGGDSTNQGNPNVYHISPGRWYPTNRPMKHWRKSGSGHHVGTFMNNPMIPCHSCKPITPQVGKPFKMLGKNEDGQNF